MTETKWTRVDVAYPVFRSSRHTTRRDARIRYIHIGEEVMRVKRVISDTSAWVERAGPMETFAFWMEPRDAPFVRKTTRGEPHADRNLADQRE